MFWFGCTVLSSLWLNQHRTGISDWKWKSCDLLTKGSKVKQCSCTHQHHDTLSFLSQSPDSESIIFMAKSQNWSQQLSVDSLSWMDSVNMLLMITGAWLWSLENTLLLWFSHQIFMLNVCKVLTFKAVLYFIDCAGCYRATEWLYTLLGSALGCLTLFGMRLAYLWHISMYLAVMVKMKLNLTDSFIGMQM